jgi:LacI family transcriptional regulator
VARQAKPTLADIAARTGYGTNTVSLALRGSTRISRQARDTIAAAARELDYVPNNHAKSLVLQKSHMVGMLLHEITNPLLTSVARALQLELARRGYGVMFATNSSPEEEDLAIEMLRSRMVDGLLIYPVDHRRLDHLRRLRERNFPVVLLIGTDEGGIDSVGVDEFRGAFDATTHLIALGHRRIGAIALTRTNTEKLEGYRHAHEVHGLEVMDSRVESPGADNIAAAVEAMDRLMVRNPDITAVFTASDTFALGALRWARLNGISVPEQLSVVGFDNIESAELAVTSLSTIKNDVSLLAATAVDRLMQLVETDGPLPEPTSVLLRGELIARESSAQRGRRPVSMRRSSRS